MDNQRWKLSLLLIALMPLLSGAGLIVGATEKVGTWDSCSSLVAYWTLDEESGTRESSLGSCTDCDLTESGTPGTDPAPWCRAASGDTGDTLSSTSTDLLTSEDRTVTGWIKTAGGAATDWVVHAWLINGYALGTRVTGSTNRTEAFNGTSTVIIEDTSSTTEYTFAAMSHDVSGENLVLCAGGSATVPDRSSAFWSCSTNSSAPASTPVSPMKINHVTNSGQTGYADDVSFWDVVLTEEEMCFICSCRPFGGDTVCSHYKGGWRNRGYWTERCGNCTLPTLDANGDASCPS